MPKIRTQVLRFCSASGAALPPSEAAPRSTPGEARAPTAPKARATVSWRDCTPCVVRLRRGDAPARLACLRCAFHPGAACSAQHTHLCAPCPATLAGSVYASFFSDISAKVAFATNSHEPSLGSYKGSAILSCSILSTAQWTHEAAFFRAVLAAWQRLSLCTPEL
jgi:hypothetical protein